MRTHTYQYKPATPVPDSTPPEHRQVKHRVGQDGAFDLDMQIRTGSLDHDVVARVSRWHLLYGGCAELAGK
jgi:hypothetical protein